MKEFKFSTPVVDALKYDKNSKYIDARAFEAEIEVIKSNSYPTKGHEYYYGIKIIISGDEAPYSIEMQISANFEVVPDDGESVKAILQDKGTGILISYARPIIADLTMRGGFAPFNMPFINL